MHRGIQLTIVLSAVLLLFTGATAAETEVVLGNTDGEFLDSLFGIFTELLADVKSLIESFTE